MKKPAESLYDYYNVVNVKLLSTICSQHGFPYIRGWMQMVLAPNDLFSWNNDTMRYNFRDGHITLLLYNT
jgi:hypothetical protein